MKPEWLIELSKQTNGRLSEVASGIIRLDANSDQADDGVALRRKAILCRTGNWDGMFGPVEITKEKLEALASKYNRERAQPLNENDYAPILVDHNRSADLIKGRLDVSVIQLSVESYSDADGNEGWALVGELRIDNEDAKKKALSGAYAQISLSFHEDTFEIYEVSFVAVEAARRSILLGQQQGDPTVNLNLEQANARVQSLQNLITSNNNARVALCQAASGSLEQINEEATSALSQVQETIVNLKTASLKATLLGCVKAGKISKKEFDAIKVEELSGLPESALKAVLTAYQSRPVSSDFTQVGKAGQTPIDDKDLANLSKDSMKQAMDAQQKGEGTISLKEEPAKDPKTVENGDEGGEEENLDGDAPSFEEVEKVVGELEALGEKFSKIEGLYKSLKSTLDKLNKEEIAE